jgi:hypothetical protein
MRRFAYACVVAAMLASGEAHAAPTVERYALSMFHFNVQYVAGGLVSYPGYSGELRPTEVEDSIVVQSLHPVLELYAAHPTWGANIEMQGYFLDVIAARHPDTFALLRDLAIAGQIEVVSFHYSDQLFIAYPQQDWERSQALAAATFEAHDVPLGTSVFCQEGQAGMAMAERMAERGYQTMVWPKNLWNTQHGDFTAAPLYTFGDIELVVGAQGAVYDDGMGLQIETTWTFFDDGELLATGDWNPYFPDLFVTDPEALAEYEASLQALEDQGYVITTVRDYADAIRDRITLSDPPPLFDGTWQPGSTNGVAKWLGDRSLWFIGGGPADRDNHVRALGYLAHREMVAAETAAQVAGLDARDELDAAWRLLALGQVTDASGINPYRGEVEYGIAHCSEALRIARGVIERAKQSLGLDEANVDPQAGTMIASDGDPFAGEPSDAAADVTITTADPMRETSVEWEQIAAGHHRVRVNIGPGDPRSGAYDVSVTFAGELVDELVTTLALADDAPYTFSRADFVFDHWGMALPLGLVSLGPDRYLIKDTGFVHLVASVATDSGDVTFSDQTQQLDEGSTWVFHVFEGSAEEAVALARSINSLRELVR